MLILASALRAADRDEWHLEYQFKQRVHVFELLNRYSPHETDTLSTLRKYAGSKRPSARGVAGTTTTSRIPRRGDGRWMS